MNIAHIIGGRRHEAGLHAQSVNPSDTGEVVAHYMLGGADVVDDAVTAAKAAAEGWAEASPEARGDILDRASGLIMQRADVLGELLAREEGKTLVEAIGEVKRAARIMRYFGGEALRRHGQALDSARPGIDVTVHREALGVVGLVTPWNFPIAIPTWKMAPALAFGNAVVLKPAESTPAIAHALVSILIESGLPDGVVNLVLGAGEAGGALSAHSGIDALSFTGSQFTGAKVAAAAIANQTRVQLEMGGKNPLVVLNDADLHRAVEIALDGGYYQTGQRCTASSRIIVEDEIHDRFVDALSERVRVLKVGHALERTTQVGPAASQQQFDQNMRYVEIALREGGRLVTGGKALTLDTPGYFMAPTLIADTDPEMRINNEEVFGPVVSTIRVKDFDHAVAIANHGNFGLSAGIVTTSLKYARAFRQKVKAGMIMVNLPTAGVDYHVPFGGARKSSYGSREQGFAAVEFYTQMKTTYIGN
jgi:aldehyde dehydrogenase (NAD+)